jgi:DNA-binding Xre family transcriptional regulator
MSHFTFAVQELAVANGDTNIYRLAKRLQVPDSRAKQLWNGDKLTKIHKDTIALICDAYDCTPNDFIKRVSNGTKTPRSKTRK